MFFFFKHHPKLNLFKLADKDQEPDHTTYFLNNAFISQLSHLRPFQTDPYWKGL